MTQQITPHSAWREIKDNLHLSLPLMTAWIIYSLGPFAGTAMIAHLGSNVLAASVLVGTIWIAGLTLFFGIFHSISVLVSQHFGAKNNKVISEVMGQAFLLNVLSWIPIILLMLSVPYLVHWSAPNKEILREATSYAHALVWVAPGAITLVILEHFLNGISRTKLSLYISLIEIPIEIILIYIFVFGKFGVPAFGIGGIGYGLAISYFFTSVILLIYLNFASFVKPFKIFSAIGKIDLRYCKEILRIGLPIGFMYFIELVAFTIATYFISTFSATSLAAHQIVMQFEGVFINIPYALSQGVSIRVGQNVGRQDKLGVWYASSVGLGISLFVALIIFIVLTFFPHLLLKIDMNIQDPNNFALMRASTSLLFILAVYQIFDTLRVIEAGALRGLKDTNYPMIVHIICFFIFGTLFAYLFGIVFHGQAQGVWWGLTLGMFLGAILLFMRLRKILVKADLAKILHI